MADETTTARLASLERYGILDTPPEAGFDEIVRLARHVCGTPIALVSLVTDDRQWFKARAGFDRTETPIAQSVCAHALGSRDLLVIPDLTQDARTRGNTLVTEAPRLRFYAGAPLETQDGIVLGTLCALDTSPRPEGLTPVQRDALVALARETVARIELRRVLAERDAALAEARRAGEAARVQAAQYEALIGTQKIVAEADGALDAVLRAVAEGAMTAVQACDGAAIELEEGDALVYRAATGALAPHLGTRLPVGRSLSGRSLREGRTLVSDDSESDPRVDPREAARLGIRSMVVSPILRHGSFIGVLKLQSARPGAFDERDLLTARLLSGIAGAGLADVGEADALARIRASEIRYRTIFDSATELVIAVTDRAGRITSWNEGARRILGWSDEDMGGLIAELLFTPEDRAAGVPEMEQALALRDGRANDDRWSLRKSGERFWANGEMVPLRGGDGMPEGFVKILRDRTVERETQIRNAALLNLGDRFRGARTPDDVLAVATATLCEVCRGDAAYVVVEPGTGEIVVAHAAGQHGPPAGRHPADAWPSLAERLRQAEAIVVEDVTEAGWPRQDSERLLQAGLGALLAPPRLRRGDPNGTFLVTSPAARRWTQAEVDALQTVADRAASALSRIRAEEQRRLVTAELSHRLKNTLAIMQAIVMQTLRSTPTVAEARTALTARLAALADAHDLLLADPTADAEIGAVVAGALRPHREADPTRIRAAGPTIQIAPRAGLAIALMLHELATNAVKYGALSSLDGYVSIAWSIERPDGTGLFRLDWREHDGPPVAAPTRQGFGSRLIEQGLAGQVGGDVTLTYAPEGVACRLETPLANIAPD